MENIEFTIREAIPEDASAILEIMKCIGGETPYMIMDEEGLKMSVEEMAQNLACLYDSPNNILMVALVGDRIIGTASVNASNKKRMEHIGEIGISILKEFWGFGLGSIMMEELIQWSKESKIIRRLELTVQQRNERAVHVYEKIGFITEALMSRGAKTDDDEFLNVYLMSLMID